jgi:hypothetical protein
VSIRWWRMRARRRRDRFRAQTACRSPAIFRTEAALAARQRARARQRANAATCVRHDRQLVLWHFAGLHLTDVTNASRN